MCPIDLVVDARVRKSGGPAHSTDTYQNDQAPFTVVHQSSPSFSCASAPCITAIAAMNVATNAGLDVVWSMSILLTAPPKSAAREAVAGMAPCHFSMKPNGDLLAWWCA